MGILISQDGRRILSQNQLSGELPVELSQLTALVVLYVEPEPCGRWIHVPDFCGMVANFIVIYYRGKFLRLLLNCDNCKYCMCRELSSFPQTTY